MKRYLILLGAVCTAIACFPVPATLGRPAATMSENRVVERTGGGSYYLRFVEELSDGPQERVYAYYHRSVTFGLPGASDVQAGLNNTDGYVVYRKQLTGETRVAEISPPATSFDVGVHALYAPTLGFPTIGAYLGANASWRAGESSVYVSYQRHFGRHTVWSSPEEPGDSYDVEHDPFQYHLVFMGVEGGTRPCESASVELYYGWAASGEARIDPIFGLNVVTGRW